MSNSRVGAVYHPDFLLHSNDFHPERQERLQAIIRCLQEKGIWQRLQVLEPETATVEQISLIHRAEYIQAVKRACSSNIRSLDIDTYINKDSFQSALRAVGGAIAAVDAVMEGRLDSCFALLRPPGHHAEYNTSMGFCIFNNIAIAAAYARHQYQLERVLLVDWDVHHGNGTQQAFYGDPGLLYFSIHQWPAFPGTGMMTEIGEAEGEGYNINFPLPPGCGDSDYLKVLEEILLPVANAYRPQLVLVSAGQDAYRDDPLAGEMLSLRAYPAMTAIVKQIADIHCQGRLALMLEGGYHIEKAAEAVSLILAYLLGAEAPETIQEDPDSTGLTDVVEQKVATARSLLAPYWPLL